jgi:hypothetical protein
VPREIAHLWRSNRRLFELLDASHQQQQQQQQQRSSDAAVEPVEKLLAHMHDTLLNLLDDYSSSPVASSSEPLQYRGKAVSVDAHSGAFVRRLSETLSIDASVAYGVWHVYLRDEFVAASVEYDDALLLDVVRVFFDERRCLVYIVAALVRAAADEQSPLQRVADRAIERLVHDGLPDRIIRQYAHLAEHKSPPSLAAAPIAVQRLAAKQHVLEQVALLELLFLVHYDKVVCPPARFLKLARLFQQHEFGAQQPNAALLDAEARAAAQRVGATAALVLVETLSLESLLEDDAELERHVVAGPLLAAARSGCSGGAGDAQQQLLAYDAELLSAPALAPLALVRLAWASVLVRVNSALAAAAKAQPYVWHVHAARALGRDGDGDGGGALKFALAALCGSDETAPPLLETDSPNLLAYKSVLKGLLSATLFSFDVAGLVAQGDIVKLHCALHEGQAEIVRQFWQQDAQHAQLGAALDLTRARFPLEIAPFVSVLASLAADADTATYVCTQYMPKQTSFCAPLLAEQRELVSRVAETRLPPSLTTPPPSVSPMQSVRYNSAAGDAAQQQQRAQQAAALDRVRFRADQPLQLTLAPFDIATGLEVAPGSDGEATRATRFAVLGGGAAVRWRVEYDGWSVCFALMRSTATSAHATLSDAQLDSTTAVLELLATLIERRPDGRLAAYLLDANPALLQQTTSLLWLAANITVAQASTMTVARQRVVLAMARAATAVLLTLASTRTVAVWNAWFARIDAGAAARGERSSSPQIDALRALINAERSRAHYAFTPVLLDLLLVFLRFAQRWPSQSAAAALPQHAAEQLAPLMAFVRVELFAPQSVWRYRSAPRRWLLGAKVLALFDAALADADADADADAGGAGDERQPPELKRRRKRDESEPSLADTLTRALLYDATFHTGLLEIVRMGYRPLSRLVAERRAQAAQQLESLIALSLSVLRRVLVAAPRGAPTALHRALLAVHSTVYDAALIIDRASAADVDDSDELNGATATSSVIAVLFGYLRPGPLYRRVAVSAAHSLAALMAGDEGAGALPPLLGYLAGSARQCRESFVDALRTDWPALQCALLDLCALALVAQPNVASWLLGEMAPVGGATPAAGGAKAGAAVAAVATSQRSNVCSVISSWLDRIEGFAARHPAVLASAMRLLRVLWARAPQHNVAAGLLRGSAAFWPSLILVVGRDAVGVEAHFPPHAPPALAASAPPELAAPLDDGVRAQLLSARASVFGVLAWEALHVSREKLDAPLLQALQPLSTRRAMLMWMINYARCSFDASLFSSLSAQLQTLGFSVESVRRARAPEEALGTPKIASAFSEPLDRTGNPAVSFVYETERLRQKLTDAGVARDVVGELVLAAARTNACVALCDAQLDLLQSWCAFVRVFFARHPNTLLPHASERSSHDGVLDLCRACAVWLEKETRETGVLDLFASELANLLLALLSDWLAQAQALPASFAPAAAAIAGTLARLGRRLSDAPSLFVASSCAAPAPAGDGARRDPLTAGRHSLLAVLASALRCVDGADEAALVDEPFRSACVAMVPPASELLSRALRASDNVVALSCTQLLSALCRRVKNGVGAHAGSALVFVEAARRLDLEQHLLALLARLLEQATMPLLAAAVLELFRALCERERESAERLFTAGLLKLLAPVRAPRGLTDGYEPYKLTVASNGASSADDNLRVAGERNEWHAVWCEALQLVATLCAVPSLRSRDSLGRQLQQFVLVHRSSAAKCVSMAPSRFGVAATDAPTTPATATAATAASASAPPSGKALLARAPGNKENDDPRTVSRHDPWNVGASSSGRRDDALTLADMATDEPATSAAAPVADSDDVRTFQQAYDGDNEQSGEPELTLARLDEAVRWLAVLTHAAQHFPQWINLVGDEARPVPLLMHVLLLVNEFALHLNAPQRLSGFARAFSREERHLTTRAAVRDEQQQQQQQLKSILKAGARDAAGASAQQQVPWDEQLTTRASFAHTLTSKMRDALLAALGVVRSVGPGIVPDEQRASQALHASDAVALSRVLFIAEMEVEHNPANGVSIGALVAAANVAVNDLRSNAVPAGPSVALATGALYLALAHLRAHVVLADGARLAVLRDEFGSELTGLIERIQRAFEKQQASGAVSKSDAEFVSAAHRFVAVVLVLAN